MKLNLVFLAIIFYFSPFKISVAADDVCTVELPSSITVAYLYSDHIRYGGSDHYYNIIGDAGCNKAEHLDTTGKLKDKVKKVISIPDSTRSSLKVIISDDLSKFMFNIYRKNTEIDCRNHNLVGVHSRSLNTGELSLYNKVQLNSGFYPELVGNTLYNRAGYVFSVRNNDVTIKDCNIEKYWSGVIIGDWVKNLRLAHDPDIENDAPTPQVVRDNGVKRVKLDNLNIKMIIKKGVYVHGFSEGTILKDSSISFSGEMGVYIEETSGFTIDNTNFTDNGLFKADAISGELSYNRNHGIAISIDASEHGLIKNSFFKNNGKGGVFLYKNCGELTPDGKSHPRAYDASNNKLLSNTFDNQLTPIWVSSRNSWSNWGTFNCTDVNSIRENPTIPWKDFSDNNEIRCNVVNNSKRSYYHRLNELESGAGGWPYNRDIIVEGMGNTIKYNSLRSNNDFYSIYAASAGLNFDLSDQSAVTSATANNTIVDNTTYAYTAYCQ